MSWGNDTAVGSITKTERSILLTTQSFSTEKVLLSADIVTDFTSKPFFPTDILSTVEGKLILAEAQPAKASPPISKTPSGIAISSRETQPRNVAESILPTLLDRLIVFNEAQFSKQFLPISVTEFGTEILVSPEQP